MDPVDALTRITLLPTVHARVRALQELDPDTWDHVVALRTRGPVPSHRITATLADPSPAHGSEDSKQ